MRRSDGNIVYYFYGHTKPNSQKIQVIYRDETIWTSFDHERLRLRLERILEYVEINTSLHGTLIRVDMFKTDEEWLVNEFEVFGSGELVSSSEDTSFINELALMAACIEATMLSYIY